MHTLKSLQVWDVLSNEEVVSIVASSPRSSAAPTLVDAAVEAWKTKLPTSKVDDCSVVCLFLNLEQDLESSTANVDPSNVVVQSSPVVRVEPEQNSQ